MDEKVKVGNSGDAKDVGSQHHKGTREGSDSGPHGPTDPHPEDDVHGHKQGHGVGVGHVHGSVVKVGFGLVVLAADAARSVHFVHVTKVVRIGVHKLFTLMALGAFSGRDAVGLAAFSDQFHGV